jgi:hypothetical protein
MLVAEPVRLQGRTDAVRGDARQRLCSSAARNARSAGSNRTLSVPSCRSAHGLGPAGAVQCGQGCLPAAHRHRAHRAAALQRPPRHVQVGSCSGAPGAGRAAWCTIGQRTARPGVTPRLPATLFPAGSLPPAGRASSLARPPIEAQRRPFHQAGLGRRCAARSDTPWRRHDAAQERSFGLRTTRPAARWPHRRPLSWAYHRFGYSAGAPTR